MVAISVLMSVHNGERFLREAINSVLAQSFGDFEFIIIDDASTDMSAQILDGYDDSRIVRLRNDTNLGLTRSLNRGLAAARGALIARHDDDDISLPERLERQLALLKNDPDAVLVAGNTEIIDAGGLTIARSRRDCDPELVGWHLMFHNHIAGHGQVMFRTDVVRRLGGYNEQMAFSQDHELWIRLADAGKILIVDETFLKTRLHTASISHTRNDQQSALSLQASRLAIECRTGTLLNLGSVTHLRNFWSGNFRALDDPQTVHRLMRQVVGAMPRSPSGVKRNHATARQFLRWAGKTSLRRNFGMHVRLTAMALKWAPGAVTRHWLWDLWAARMGGGQPREGAAS